MIKVLSGCPQSARFVEITKNKSFQKCKNEPISGNLGKIFLFFKDLFLRSKMTHAQPTQKNGFFNVFQRLKWYATSNGYHMQNKSF